MTVPSDSIYGDKFVREVNGNIAINIFVKHKQSAVSSTFEEATPSQLGDHIVTSVATALYNPRSRGYKQRVATGIFYWSTNNRKTPKTKGDYPRCFNGSNRT